MEVARVGETMMVLVVVMGKKDERREKTSRDFFRSVFSIIKKLISTQSPTEVEKGIFQAFRIGNKYFPFLYFFRFFSKT